MDDEREDWKEMDGIGGEEFSGVGEQMEEKKGRRERERERDGSSRFSVPRLRTSTWSVSRWLRQSAIGGPGGRPNMPRTVSRKGLWIP
jgi:hypothetical protein